MKASKTLLLFMALLMQRKALVVIGLMSLCVEPSPTGFLQWMFLMCALWCRRIQGRLYSTEVFALTGRVEQNRWFICE